MAQRVIITGAGGFVGRHLVAHLLGDAQFDGAEIVACTTGAANEAGVGGNDARVRRHVLDVTDAEATRALIARVQPTGIVHLAAISLPRMGDREPHLTWSVNVLGTLNLVQAVLAEAPDAVFVHVGSSESYGGSFNATRTALDETAPFDPLTTYAASKASGDLLVGQKAREGLRAVRMRPFNHTGPGQADSYAIPAFASQIAAIERGQLEPVLRVGNLEGRRDFSDVRDVVRAYALALRADVGHRGTVAPGTAFNVCSGTSHKVGELLEGLRSLSSVQFEIVPDRERLRRDDIATVTGDASSARALLGWSPSIPLTATLADVLADWRSRVA